MKALSAIGYLGMVRGLVALLATRHIFSSSPLASISVGGQQGKHPAWKNYRVVIHAKVGSIVCMRTSSSVKIDPQIMSGEPCFAGTRVPVRTLLDYLEGGDSLDEFLEDFPTVPRELAISFLEQSAHAMLATIAHNV